MSIVYRYHHYGEEEERVPLRELDIHPELLQVLAELGVIEIREETILPQQLQRVYRLLRLKQTGVNLPGAAIILDLLERIEALEDEVDRLTGH